MTQKNMDKPSTELLNEIFMSPSDVLMADRFSAPDNEAAGCGNKCGKGCGTGCGTQLANG